MFDDIITKKQRNDGIIKENDILYYFSKEETPNGTRVVFVTNKSLKDVDFNRIKNDIISKIKEWEE